MRKEEFLEKIKQLNDARINLKRDYILEHAPYPINTIVKVKDNRSGELLFEGVISTYFVSSLTGRIDVVIHKITKKRTISKSIRKYYNIEDSKIIIIREG